MTTESYIPSSLTDSTGRLSAEDPAARKLDEFEYETKRAEEGTDESWIRCAHWTRKPRANFEVWKKFDESTGLNWLRLRATISARTQTVAEVLYEWNLRRKWDKVFIEYKEYPVEQRDEEISVPVKSSDTQKATSNGMKEDQSSTSEDGTNESQVSTTESIIYVRLNMVPGVMHRDLVYRRVWRTNPSTGEVTVADMSVEDARFPMKPDCVRAHTWFSGAIVKPHPTDANRTIFETISLVDIRGDVPKLLINTLGTRTSVSWLKKLDRACMQHEQGKLKPRGDKPELDKHMST